MAADFKKILTSVRMRCLEEHINDIVDKITALVIIITVTHLAWHRGLTGNCPHKSCGKRSACPHEGKGGCARGRG